MNDLRQAAQQALEALESLFNWKVDPERGKRCGDAVVALRAALAQQAEPAACSNTFGCRCPKHFVAQQSEQRPKRVLTAVWRDRAQRAEAQRDALLEALKAMLEQFNYHTISGIVHDESSAIDRARAAIRACNP